MTTHRVLETGGRRHGMPATGALILAASMALWPVPAAGQTLDTPVTTQSWVDPARGISVDELVAQALRDAPAIRAGRSREDEARAAALQAGLRPNPTLSAARREDPGTPGYQTSVGIAWPLDLFRRDGRVGAATSGIALARIRATEDEWRLADAVRRQAGRTLSAVRRLEISGALATAARQTLDLVTARVDAGAAPALERSQAEIAWRRHQVQSIRLRAEVETAMAALRALAGLEPSAPLVLRDALEIAARAPVDAEADPTVATPDSMDVEERPDVRAASAAIDLSAAGRDLAERVGRFDASLTAGYARTRNSLPQQGLDAFGQPTPLLGRTHALTVGLNVTLPWRNRNQGNVAAAEAAVRTATHVRDAARLEAAAEIAAAEFRHAEARRALEVFDAGVRDLAARNLDVVRESYTLGRATLVDVLDETRRYLDFETAYTAALTEAFDAKVELRAARGGIR